MNTKALEIGGALQLSTTKKKPYLLLFLRTTVLTGLFSVSSGRSSSNSQKTKAALGPQLLRGPHHRPTTPSWAASPYGNDLFAFPHSNPNLLFLLDGKFRGPWALGPGPGPRRPLARTSFQPPGAALPTRALGPETRPHTAGSPARARRQLPLETPPDGELSSLPRTRSGLSFPGGCTSAPSSLRIRGGRRPKRPPGAPGSRRAAN